MDTSQFVGYTCMYIMYINVMYVYQFVGYKQFVGYASCMLPVVLGCMYVLTIHTMSCAAKHCRTCNTTMCYIHG